jgi:hypothetical protein
MTSSIDDSQDLRAPAAPGLDPDGRPTTSALIRSVRIITVSLAFVGIGVLSAAFAHNEWRTGVVGFTLIVAACTGAVVWAIDAMLADRNAFYERGSLDGFMRCWRGELPSAKDPLVRR